MTAIDYLLRPAVWMAAAAICFCDVPVASAGEPESRPNILLAISDDQSWLHAGAYGDAVVKTPVFDRVARQGVLFANAFCSAPSCTPSRAAILTGQDFWRLGAGANLFGTLPKQFTVYPDLLESAGYWVGYTRKGWAPGDAAAGGRTRNPAGNEFDDFAQFLERAPSGKPFCFWFGSTDPHRPYEKGSGLKSGKRLQDVVVPPFLPDVPEIRSDLLDYYVEIERFDQQVGQILALIEARGELENTIVIITSDNGMPFPRGKTNLYDHGTRMPLAISWPAKIKGDRVLDDFVNLTDLAPTFLEVAGRSAPSAMTGRSLVPLLAAERAGQIDPARDRVFVGRERHGWNREPNVGYPCRAVRTADYLYIRNFQPQRQPGFDTDNGPTRAFMLNHRHTEFRQLFQLWFEQRPAEELYDLSNDPAQIVNVADQPQYAQVKNQLHAELQRYLKQTGDPRASGQGAVFDEYRYFGRPTGNQRLLK